MINYVIYGHSDYLDVLQIQTDYISGRGNLILLINNNSLNLEELYSKYDKVIFYNDNLPYSGRLLSCMPQIDFEYFIFIHDIDILINVDDSIINKLHKFLSINDYDRIDLKHFDILDTNEIIKIDNLTDPSEWTQVGIEEMSDGVFLIKQTNPNHYIYNVNPSIWKKESFNELLSTFPNRTYRDIEMFDVQVYCSKFNVFKLFSNKHLLSGYFKTLNLFKFLHISHSGKLLPLNNTYTTIYGQSYIDVKDDYINIVEKYNLKKSSKWITD